MGGGEHRLERDGVLPNPRQPIAALARTDVDAQDVERHPPAIAQLDDPTFEVEPLRPAGLEARSAASAERRQVDGGGLGVALPDQDSWQHAAVGVVVALTDERDLGALPQPRQRLEVGQPRTHQHQPRPAHRL